LQNEKYEFEASISGVENMVKEKIARQTSMSEIVKQGIKNIPEKQKAAAAMKKAEQKSAPVSAK